MLSLMHGCKAIDFAGTDALKSGLSADSVTSGAPE